MSSKTDQELSQIQISEYEVEQCLNNLDTSKAYGPDGIPHVCSRNAQRKSHQAFAAYLTNP